MSEVIKFPTQLSRSENEKICLEAMAAMSLPSTFTLGQRMAVAKRTGAAIDGLRCEMSLSFDVPSELRMSSAQVEFVKMQIQRAAEAVAGKVTARALLGHLLLEIRWVTGMSIDPGPWPK